MVGIEIRDLRDQDWVWTSTVVLFHPDIDASAYKTYCGLAAHANNSSQKAFPGIDTLARKIHVSRNTVIKAIKSLEETAFLKVDRTTGQNNIYYLLKVIGDEVVRKPKKAKGGAARENWVTDILQWAETKKGAKFVNYGKQVGALGAMQKSEYTPEQIRKCYELMEQDSFWRQKGFDFTNVANEIHKRARQIKQNGIFDALTTR